MLGPSTPSAPVQSAVIAPPTSPVGARGPATATQANPPAAMTKPSGGPTTCNHSIRKLDASGTAVANANLAITAAAKPSKEAPTTDGPAPQMRPQSATPDAPDPIAEAPEMIWYVRPPSGGQFGPAPGELMRTWLGEGRVDAADSLVWARRLARLAGSLACFPKNFAAISSWTFWTRRRLLRLCPHRILSPLTTRPRTNDRRLIVHLSCWSRSACSPSFWF